ncbi:MAG TPA: Ppx/GppA phosphatase family protein [Bdellovibrionales bacterium]|nr:Ppx/GppA phosphatase family protein [Bdellovibrionales bacterium]
MRVAALDFGTNTFLLLIADVVAGEIQKVLHDEVRVVRLGQGVHENRRFHQEALARANDCLKDFSKTIQSLGAEKVLACATSAARDVSNAQDLIDMAAGYGIPMEVISGDREAELTFKGTIDGRSGPVAIVDVGGGSTEFILGDGKGIRARQSVDVGSVRLTELFITKHPIPSDQLSKMNDYIQNKMSEASTLLDSAKVERVVAVAGTPTTLAAVDQGLEFESNRVDGYRLSRERLEYWTQKLAEMTVEERQKLAGMEPKRADVIVAGSSVLVAAAKALKAKEFVVSVRGLRYGVARTLGE